jgi:hypothetical protein
MTSEMPSSLLSIWSNDDEGEGTSQRLLTPVAAGASAASDIDGTTELSFFDPDCLEMGRFNSAKVKKD